MTKSPKETHHPFLFLDEFNRGTDKDLVDLDTFMRACQSRGITSERQVADNIIKLNAWAKIRPLKYIHNGPTTNIYGQPGYDVNKTPDWKNVNWTRKQLKQVVIAHEGEFEDYSFIVPEMMPCDALWRQEKSKVDAS